MKKKEEMKVSLATGITLAVIFIVVLLVGIIILLNSFKNKETKQNIINNNESTVNNNVTSNNLINNDNNNTVSNNKDFATEFLKLENNKQNMIYSPLSIRYALKMLSDGANGNTKKQIEEAIGNLQLTKYNNIENVLSLANGMYIRNTYAEYVKKDFENKLIKDYDAEIKYDEFKDANNINQWIEDKTLKIIKNMLSDNMVQNSDNVMLLINALAIDMEWEDAFDASETNGEKFTLENGTEMLATMMNQETSSDNISYYKDEDITALTMDLKKYEDTQMEFIAIMPNNNLSNYINNFTTDTLDNIVEKATLASETKKGLNIYIPKFSFDYDLKLKNDLIKMGITDVFDANVADLSNISSSKLYANDALHKANIDFSEKGVKAAAVTVFGIKNLAMADIEQLKPEEVRIDKPFLYVIRDKETKEIFFIGTLYEPNSWDKDKVNY